MFATLFTLAMMAAPHGHQASAQNTKCPVLGRAVTSKSQVVTVHGHAYRVCCSDCAGKLEKHPGAYLKKDGTPKNATKPIQKGSMASMPGMRP